MTPLVSKQRQWIARYNALSRYLNISVCVSLTLYYTIIPLAKSLEMDIHSCALTIGNILRCCRRRKRIRPLSWPSVNPDGRRVAGGCAQPRDRALVSWPADIQRIRTERVWPRTSNGTLVSQHQLRTKLYNTILR